MYAPSLFTTITTSSPTAWVRQAPQRRPLTSQPSTPSPQHPVLRPWSRQAARKLGERAVAATASSMATPQSEFANARYAFHATKSEDVEIHGQHSCWVGRGWAGSACDAAITTSASSPSLPLVLGGREEERSEKADKRRGK
ncbi:hypothetical protein CVT26_009038 [Gymnopilus dilepis]|uniref:Uncharacterized protein n=1 Tax=Gymnopilus dilepis TaxID=231916 RepID=A0A409WCS1_9AGAR|nr:hypothetical protein CVT26_009038 [Gymnopilus dilepis]